MKVRIYYKFRDKGREMGQPIMFAYTKNKEYAKMFEDSRNMKIFYKKEVNMTKKEFLLFQDKYQELQLDCFKFETVSSRPLMKYDTVILVCTMAEAKYVYILSDNLYNKMGGFTIPEALHVKDKYKSTLEYLSYYSALVWHSNYSGDAQDYNIEGLNIFNDKGKRVDKFRLFMEYFGDTMEGYEFDDEEYEE